MHVIIVGAGEVGSTIAESLSDTHDVVVVDVDPDRVETLTYELDVLAIQGDGGNIDTLREAGIAEADMLIASTDDDETNIVACGTAAVGGDPFTIARVKRPQYLDTWEQDNRAFDADFMVCTDLLAARTIVGVIGLPTAQDVDSFCDGAVQMTEFEIPADSPVAGQTVQEADRFDSLTFAGQTVQEADRFDSLTFAGIIREDDLVVPSGDTVIEAGDDVVVIGSPESARAFSSAIAPQENRPSDIVIVGGGEVGYQTARLLEERDFSPRLVERDGERARWLAEQLPNTTVLESDATDRSFLERENVGEADAVIAALENDQQNLLATLLAKRLGARRAVAVVDTVAFAELFEAVGVDVAVSPREATAEEITRFTRGRHAENVAIVEGDRAEVLEVEIDDASVFAGRSIREAAADLPEEVVVGAITRKGEFIVPRGDTVVEAGDHVVVFVGGDHLDRVTELL